MKNRKKIIKIAKIMFRDSLSEGLVDTKLVSQILKKIIVQKPPGLINILKIYKRLIETQLKKEEIILEAGSKIANQKKLEKELIKRTGAQRIKFKIDPGIVFGARVTHGDWIYDATLDAKLKQLTR